ncbi:Natural killer cell receptor 2B4 [Heterocephalus glaber]|uniref:Natural killer cell receptor 2B4 n=1 Tax=Heterocephalus glaber TaxID=10181 RepID=G5BWJ4_HETGA|nr:Natural killer cell receptor 2B4 [Heterocephalus glaber]
MAAERATEESSQTGAVELNTTLKNDIWLITMDRTQVDQGKMGMVPLLKGLATMTGECSDSTDPVVGLSGLPLSLRPLNTQMKEKAVEWRMQLPSLGKCKAILKWKNNKNVSYATCALEYFNNTLDFESENWTLLIKSAKPQYSGLYKLELTNANGTVSCFQFKVSVFDHVEKPRLKEEWKAVGEGKCLVNLSCLGSRNGNVSYAWYRGSELIPTLRNLSHLVVHLDANEPDIYTCNVSNPASWASESLNLTQGCLEPRFPLLLVVIVILVALFLGTLTCFFVWKRKRKRSQSSPPELLTVYEDVKEIRRNQARFKKKNQDPSCNCTIYAQVGNRPLEACNSARLGRKELKIFDIYS